MSDYAVKALLKNLTKQFSTIMNIEIELASILKGLKKSVECLADGVDVWFESSPMSVEEMVVFTPKFSTITSIDEVLDVSSDDIPGSAAGMDGKTRPTRCRTISEQRGGSGWVTRPSSKNSGSIIQTGIDADYNTLEVVDFYVINALKDMMHLGNSSIKSEALSIISADIERMVRIYVSRARRRRPKSFGPRRGSERSGSTDTALFQRPAESAQKQILRCVF